jgi:hypothetical protein
MSVASWRGLVFAQRWPVQPNTVARLVWSSHTLMKRPAGLRHHLMAWRVWLAGGPEGQVMGRLGSQTARQAAAANGYWYGCSDSCDRPAGISKFELLVRYRHSVALVTTFTSGRHSVHTALAYITSHQQLAASRSDAYSRAVVHQPASNAACPSDT